MKYTLTATFDLTNIGPHRFIEWLETECGIAEDGDGPMHGTDTKSEAREVRIRTATITYLLTDK